MEGHAGSNVMFVSIIPQRESAAAIISTRWQRPAISVAVIRNRSVKGNVVECGATSNNVNTAWVCKGRSFEVRFDMQVQ